jgi:hypothetical protein
MYTDPALIRKHTVKLSLSDREAALLDAMASYTGEQKAVLLRELLIERAMEVLHGEANGAAQRQEMRGTLDAHQVA